MHAIHACMRRYYQTVSEHRLALRTLASHQSKKSEIVCPVQSDDGSSTLQLSTALKLATGNRIDNRVIEISRLIPV